MAKITLVTAALSPLKGSVVEALGVAAAYANDLVERKEFLVDGNPTHLFIIWKTAATTATLLNADAGYAKMPGGSIAFTVNTGNKVCRKGGDFGVTTGTWAEDA